MLALFTLASAGCHPREHLKLHYLPGFVPGSQNIFHPARLAIAPVSGDSTSGRVGIGAIYAADGTVQQGLYVIDAGTVVTAAVIRALGDAGLSPLALDAMPADQRPPPGADYILLSELTNIEVNKRFRAQQTVHGQYFAMEAVVRIKFSLVSRAGETVYSGELTGTEEEPPAPVGGEVFLPLETDPAESLSVALSRAAGALVLQPDFARALPLRTVESPVPIATPKASAPAAPSEHR